MMQTQVDSDAPSWLVEFVMTPPLWFKAVLVLAAGVCLAVAARKVAKDDFYIPNDEQRQILLIVGTAEGVALGVIASMDVLGLGYFAAVGVGLVGGFASVEILRRCDPILDAFTRDETAHIAVAWAVIGTTAFIAPSFVEAGQAGQALSMGVGVVAAAMLLWAVFQEAGEGDTLGEAIREGATDD